MEIIKNEDFERGYYDGYSDIIKESGNAEPFIKKAVEEASKISSSKEIAKIMRNLFKKLGYGTKDLSIVMSRGGYESSIRIKIKTYKASLDKDFIKNVADRFKHIDYDERSGEILAGGNLFIFVDIDSSVEDQLRQELKPIANEIEAKIDKANKDDNDGVLCFKTKKKDKVWAFRHGKALSIEGSSGHFHSNSIYCNSIEQGLAILVLNQKQFGISLDDIMTADFKANR